MTKRTIKQATVVPIGANPRHRRRNASQPRRARGTANEVRAAILETARELYARGGYDGVTMGAVAHQLGIKAPSLYHHFSSKDAIFRELQRQTFTMLANTLSPEVDGALENLREYFWRYYQFSKVNRAHFALLYADPATPQFEWMNLAGDAIQSLTEVAHRRVRQCIKEGVLPRRTNVAHVSNILWGATHGVAMLRIVSRPPGYQFDRLAADTIDAVLSGLRHAPAKARQARRRRV